MEKTDDTADDDTDLDSRDLSREDLFADQDDDDIEKTDLEVSKYNFCARLAHYMEGMPINEENRCWVEMYEDLSRKWKETISLDLSQNSTPII